eukprot:5984476-Pleurochrysis_carterae.AAC.2
MVRTLVHPPTLSDQAAEYLERAARHAKVLEVRLLIALEDIASESTASPAAKRTSDLAPLH